MNRKMKSFLEAYDRTGCNKSAACKACGVSRQTVYNWAESDPKFAMQMEDIEESNIDYVETKLMTRISQGDTTAIIFFLKTKGKHRGYVERTETTGANGAPLIPPKELTNDELKELLLRLENE